MVSQFGSLGYTIMGKTADLTVVQKTIIDTLYKEGKPQTFIAKEAGCSQSAVSKHVNQMLSERKKCGRKRCTINRENSSLVRIVKQNRFKNLCELHKEWTEAGVKASRATTHRHVKEFGYSCCQRRLTWAKEKKNWTVAQWSKVLFSDVSKFCILFGNQDPTSRELVSRHRDIVLGHIHSLGLRMKAKKSVLLPSQRTVFLGVHLDSVQMQARLAPARIPVFTACLARFKLGHHVSVGTCRRLLGLMAAASPVLLLGLLHMRPFLWWMKELRLHPTVPATRLIRVSRSCCRHLLMWRVPVFLQSGVRMGAIHRRHMITTDASMTGWGAVFEGRPASGEWKEEFLFWHINCLELRAVFLALKYFLPVLGGHHIIVRTDNMAVVSHINRQGGSKSRTLDRLARHLLLWSQDKFLSLRAVHVLGVLNLAADFLSRQKLKPGEWMLNRQTVSQIWDLFGKAEVDLFASQESSQCPLWFSLSFLTTLGIDAFTHPWPNVSLYMFPPIKLIPAVLRRVKVSGALLLLIAPFWPSQTWFSELTPLLYRPPWEIPIRRDLLSQLQGKIWHPQPELWKLWVWPIQGQGLWLMVCLPKFRKP